jgi:hypothetical protein
MEDDIDRLDFVTESDKKHLRQIAQELTVGRVVLFAGAGLSFNAPRRDGGSNSMPGWKALAASLLERMEEQVSSTQDPLEIADYFETKFGRPALIDALVDTIRDSEHAPGRVHQCITSLNFEEIITTNFDTLIERAFSDKQFIEPQVVVESRDLVRKRKPPRVIKMNGCFKINPSGIVITASDFLSYAEKHPLVEILVTKSFVESTVLFIGFGLDDPAFRAINERVLRTLGQDECRLSFSLLYGASPTQVEFWRLRQVQILDLSRGEPAGPDREERLYLVLQALLAKQKERFLGPRRQPRAPLISSGSPFSAREEEQYIKDWYSALKVIAPRLEESRSLGLLRSRSGLADMLRECRARAREGEKGEEPIAVRRLLNSLVKWLKEICRFEDIRSPGLEFRAETWLPIAELVDLLVESDLDIRGDGIGERDLGANLRVLAALLSTKLLIVSPKLTQAGQPTLAKAGAASRFLKTVASLGFWGLSTEDMLIRSRFLTLLFLFGPISSIDTLLHVWEDERDESELAPGRRKKRQRTPVEYRTLLLNFQGSPKHQRLSYLRAAESLWSRQMFGDEQEGVWRIESAFRYGYLRQAVPEMPEIWSGVRLHHERLERVLGRLALEPEPVVDSGKGTSYELLALLLELNRGWLFGCPPPAALSRAWELADEALAGGEEQSVPWEALLLISLPLEGRQLFQRWGQLITAAWKRGHLDMDLLIQAVELRIRDWELRDLFRDHPVARYESGLAFLVRRLIERTLSESEGEPLRERLAGLIKPVGQWLACTEEQEVREDLLISLALLRQVNPEASRPIVLGWIDSQLKRSPQGAHLGLSLLDPKQSDLLITVDQIGILLAHAQSGEAKGTRFRDDVLKWFISWSDSDALLPFLAPWARQISSWLQPWDARWDFDWLSLATRVRTTQALRQEVEKVLGVDPTTPSLYVFVKRVLLNLNNDQKRLWRMKDGFLGTLVPFAPDFDEELAAFLDSWLDPESVTDSGRDGAAALLAGLLSQAPQPLKQNYQERWLEALRGLIRRGAVGHGLLGKHALALGPPASQTLQDNLLGFLERPRRRRPDKIVSWVSRTIADGNAVPMTDLEEKLIQSVDNEDFDLAWPVLEEVVKLLQEIRDFESRNHSRLRRVRLSAERRRAFRPSSRFAELLQKLPAD